MSLLSTNKLVILDRDGVINFDSDHYIKSEEEWKIIPGSAAAIARLSKAGFKVAVATNQSGLARGYFSQQTLTQMHKKMCALVQEAGGKINTIKFCPHHPDDQCLCRKPGTGLLTQISEELNIPAYNAPFIGDSLSDIKAALSGDCKPMLVLTGKGQRTLATQDPLLESVPKFSNLAEAVEAILTT